MTRYPHDLLATLRRASGIVLFVVYLVGVAASLYFVGSRRLAADGVEGVQLIPQGGLEIKTRPAGAVVRLNEASLGVTPVANPELKPGRSSITIGLDGYLPWRGTIDVPSRQFVETGTIPLVPRLPRRQETSITAGTSYPIPGDRPIVAHVTGSSGELVILDSHGWMQDVPGLRVDSVGAHTASESVVVFGERDSRRVVVVIEQRLGGIRVREFAIGMEVPPTSGIVPVRSSAANDALLAFTPEYGVSIDEAGIELHELWSGALVAWGAPEGVWSALTEDGDLLRYTLGVVHRTGNLGPVPVNLKESTIIGVSDTTALLRTRSGAVILLKRDEVLSLVDDGVLDSARAGEDTLLASDDSIAVMEDDGTIRARLPIPGAGVESLVGVSSTGLVVFETAVDIKAVPLAAVRHAELTLAPVSVARLEADEHPLSLFGETLVYGSDRRIIWQSLEAPEDAPSR